MNKTVYIHLDKTTQLPFYVGMGNSGREYDFNKGRRSENWNEYVENHGLPIVWPVALGLDKTKAAEIEEALILHYGRIGVDANGILVNQSIGIGAKGMVYSEERNKKITASKTGYRFSEDAKQKMSVSHTGKLLSSSHKASIGNSIRGEKNGRYGVALSESTKEKLRLANIGKKQSPETIAKRIESRRKTTLLKQSQWQ